MTSLFQFSIRSLLAAVTVIALGIVALLNANVWWEAAAWITALVLLASGILLVVYRRDEKRAYWLGFAIFGGLYLGVYLFVAILYGPYRDPGPSPEPLDALVTTRISQMAYEAIIPASRRDQFVSATYPDGTSRLVTLYQYQVMTSPPPPAPPSPSAGAPTAWPTTTSTGPAGPAPPPPSTFGQAVPSTVLAPNVSYVSIVTFVSIAHSLWLLLAAAIGGKVCQWIHRTRPKESQP